MKITQTSDQMALPFLGGWEKGNFPISWDQTANSKTNARGVKADLNIPAHSVLLREKPVAWIPDGNTPNLMWDLAQEVVKANQEEHLMHVSICFVSFPDCQVSNAPCPKFAKIDQATTPRFLQNSQSQEIRSCDDQHV